MMLNQVVNNECSNLIVLSMGMMYAKGKVHLQNLCCGCIEIGLTSTALDRNQPVLSGAFFWYEFFKKKILEIDYW